MTDLPERLNRALVVATTGPKVVPWAYVNRSTWERLRPFGYIEGSIVCLGDPGILLPHFLLFGSPILVDDSLADDEVRTTVPND